MLKFTNLLVLAACTGCSLFLAAPHVAAVPTLSLSDGMGNVGSISSTSGVVVFNGILGNFTMNVTTGMTQPALGSATNPMLSLNSVHVTGTPGGTLTVMFSDIFFGPFSGSFASQLSGTISPGGSISYSTFADSRNVLFGMGTPLTSQGSLSALSYSGNAFASMANAFSLTQLVVITLDANGEARFGATLTGNSGARGLTQQVPDAGSSLVLLGTGVIVVELLRRRVARSFAI